MESKEHGKQAEAIKVIHFMNGVLYGSFNEVPKKRESEIDTHAGRLHLGGYEERFEADHKKAMIKFKASLIPFGDQLAIRRFMRFVGLVKGMQLPDDCSYEMHNPMDVFQNDGKLFIKLDSI